MSIRIDGREMIRYAYNESGDVEEARDALGNAHRFRYGSPGRPEEIQQPDGSRVHITYDGRGNILEITDAFGSSTRFAYDALNRVTETVDGNGNRTRYEYDPSGNITRVVNAEGRERLYRYNESGKVTEIRDFDGSVVKREYNALNRPCRLIDQEGRETLLTYDVMWNLARVTEPNGAKTTYIYNGQNRLERVRKANGAQVRYAYDAVGNRIGVTDEEGNRTSLSYDALGRLIRVTDPEGAETAYEYDALGNMTKVTDACGNTVLLTYDAMGRLIRETNALGESRHYAYTALGKAESVTDEAGRITRYEYEPGGRMKRILYPDGTWEAFTYDGNGNVLTRTRETGFVQSYTYDSLDRIIRIQGSGGESKSYAYDAVGNVIRMTDGLGNSTHYEYTPAGRLKKVTDPMGNETEYGYDVCDRLIEIRQYGEFGNPEENEQDKSILGMQDNSVSEMEAAPFMDRELLEVQEHNRESRSCQITRYERDLSGQVTGITDALGREERYTYGKRGELLSKLDKDGYLTTYGYTEKGDINRIQYADGREVRLSYNPLRQLEELEDWLGTTQIENDPLGRAVKVSYPEGETVSYSYGKAGERTSLTYPDGRTVTYGYDELSRLTELRDGERSIRYAYDAQGRLEEKRFPGGMTSRYAYDDQGRIESLTHSDREGILDAYTYRYDILGNKTAIEKQRRGLREESGSYAYGYDALGRLSSVTKDGTLLRSYAYDAFGNRTGLREGERETRYTYNVLNQLVSLTDGETTEKYAYDKRGNLTEHLRNGTLVNRYMYGALNRLEKAVNGEGVQASYQYNGLGYRTGKSVRESLPDPEKQVRYTIDLTRQYHNLLQKEEEGEILSFLWDGGAAGMRRTGGLGAEGMRPESQEYYLQDDLGSPIRLLSESGEVTESYGYDEFGRDLYGNQGEMQPFGYTGYQYDWVSDTYFAQAREYVPGIGRFVGRDLSSGMIEMPLTMNQYSYCFNNSLILVDLDGAWPSWEEIKEVGKNGFEYVKEKVYGKNYSIYERRVEDGNFQFSHEVTAHRGGNLLTNSYSYDREKGKFNSGWSMGISLPMPGTKYSFGINFSGKSMDMSSWKIKSSVKKKLEGHERMEYSEAGAILDSEGLSIYGKEGKNIDITDILIPEEYNLQEDEKLSYSYTMKYNIADWDMICGAITATVAAITLAVVIVDNAVGVVGDEAATPGLLTYIMNYIANAKEIINQFFYYVPQFSEYYLKFREQFPQMEQFLEVCINN